MTVKLYCSPVPHFTYRLKNAWYGLTVLLFTLFYCTAKAQEYDYVHYGIKEGLAGNCIYDISQGKDGFIWLATETGVSRFDSRHFTNYTTADGLPDNEVLGFLSDDYDRTWFIHFIPHLSYYKNGKIYTKQNDSLLAKLSGRAVRGMEKDQRKRLWVFNPHEIYVVDNDAVTVINSVNGQRFTCDLGYQDMKGNIFAIFDIGYYRINTDDDSFIYIGKSLSLGRNSFINPQSGMIESMPMPGIIRAGNIHSDLQSDILYINTLSGSFEYDWRKKKFSERYLPGEAVSNTYRDAEGTLWISTLSNGIYKLKSKAVKKYLNTTADRTSVTSLEVNGGEILVGTSNKGIYRIDASGALKAVPVSENSYLDYKNKGLKIITKLKVAGNKVFCVVPNKIIRFSSRLELSKNSFNFLSSIKDIFPFRNQLMVATSNACKLYDINTGEDLKTILRMRTTTAYADSSGFFIGTLEGLIMKPLNAPVSDTLNDKPPVIPGRISKIISAGKDSGIWVATYADGVYRLKNGRIIQQITTKDGLISNCCRALYLNGDTLWIGTDKGLCCFDQSKKNIRIDVFTSAEGLCSDIVNSICVYKGMVYAGTMEGLSSFRPADIVRRSKCDLKILNVILGDAERDVNSDEVYPGSYDKNRLRILFAALSFRTTGDITYYYRMTPGNSNWMTTKETVLEFQSLPTGKLQLEIRAVDGYGATSPTRVLHFYISPPFWATTWFRILAILACVAVIAGIMYAIIAFKRKKHNAKQVLSVKLSELEQMALRAQMNPHFIFNCLNSVQLYILKNDAAGANYYLIRFANLVRQTLENAPRTYISLSEELQYLKNYLELEEMQTDRAFGHELSVDPRLQPDQVFIPNMIIQPFVENAIKHGVSQLRDGTGKIRIDFGWIDDTRFSCSIEDNGPGIQENDQPKQEWINSKPKGLSITRERIDILNTMNKEKKFISTVVENMIAPAGNVCGARVLIHFPLITDEKK